VRLRVEARKMGPGRASVTGWAGDDHAPSCHGDFSIEADAADVSEAELVWELSRWAASAAPGDPAAGGTVHLGEVAGVTVWAHLLSRIELAGGVHTLEHGWG